MPVNDKLIVLQFLKDHPNSSAKEIYKGCGLPPKAHSAALYSMKNTGLILASYNLGNNSYPTYRINPDADPGEIENPHRIYNRARGPQKKHRIGSIEERILSALSTDKYVPLSEIYPKVGENVRMAYTRKLLNRLEEIGYVEHSGEEDERARSWKLLKYPGKTTEDH